jgi:hypothetical protein
MKRLINTVPVIFPLFLAGCAPLEQAGREIKSEKQIQPVTTQEVAKETLPQICQAAKDNRVRANDYYSNKGLAVTGEVKSVNEGFQPHYRVYMKAGTVHVHAGTENLAAAKQLTVGKTTKVMGVITDVSYGYDGCSISLKDATF